MSEHLHPGLHPDADSLSGFIEGALPGVPLSLGAAALGISVYQAGQQLDMAGIDRMWLQMVARKE